MVDVCPICSTYHLCHGDLILKVAQCCKHGTRQCGVHDGLICTMRQVNIIRDCRILYNALSLGMWSRMMMSPPTERAGRTYRRQCSPSTLHLSDKFGNGLAQSEPLELGCPSWTTLVTITLCFPEVASAPPRH
jgi:hypothetical protein